MGVVGQIDVYFQGATYLSKVIVNSYISNTSSFTFSGPTNYDISINDLNTNFDFPISMISWGRNFISNSNPTNYRGVNLFNNTSLRVDYDTGAGTLNLTNATPSNLGSANQTNLPSSETLVASVYLTYKV